MKTLVSIVLAAALGGCALAPHWSATDYGGPPRAGALSACHARAVAAAAPIPFADPDHFGAVFEVESACMRAAGFRRSWD